MKLLGLEPAPWFDDDGSGVVVIVVVVQPKFTMVKQRGLDSVMSRLFLYQKWMVNMDEAFKEITLVASFSLFPLCYFGIEVGFVSLSF